MAVRLIPVPSVDRLVRISYRLATWPFRFLWRGLVQEPAQIRGWTWVLAFYSVILGLILTVGLIVQFPAQYASLVVAWIPALVFLLVRKAKPRGGPKRLARRRR